MPSPFSPGPRPVGDPAGMRRYALSLQIAADDARAAGRQAATCLADATFVGPAGDAARQEAADLRHRSAGEADRLHDLARDITQRAGQVERDQRMWDRAKARMDRRDPFPVAQPFG